MALQRITNVNSAARSGLERALRREIETYRNYLVIAEQERAAVTGVELEELTELTQARSQALEQLEAATITRQNAVAALFGDEFDDQGRAIKDGELVPTIPLGERIESTLPLAEVALFTPLVDTLRELVGQAREEAVAQRQITAYASQLLHGAVAIMRSDGAAASPRYGKNGKIDNGSRPFIDPKLSSIGQA